MAAQELVQAARGKLIGRAWRLKSETEENIEEEVITMASMASVDDISVMVVPLYPYLCEHRQWIRMQQQERRHSLTSTLSLSTNATT